ncbi:hypothetical protein A2U01_0075894, partial [Trifolium medium]|nr:hypothetical protein [Trifolium medium]
MSWINIDDLGSAPRTIYILLMYNPHLPPPYSATGFDCLI